ncbi:DUF4012 domain-containing protein [Sinomonas sp. JGH33]|uniref:DUF4012 domain-containing protein n=1 Tax=Sinomonas terricola TaxID=3110330 RepID=A0ABU5TBG4_9MICC|nr:DUF4012 domain-containing protein [Sinomonas sp. JGH33]MEA5456985.1 DUF4012 domain-containing protein [Sinomonas sp. JGH33]
MTSAPVKHAAPSRRRALFDWRSRRVRAWGIGAVVLLVLVAAAVWLGVRAHLAQQEIAEAERLAKVVQTQIAQGHADQARDAAQQLASHVDSAHGYVSDPVWLSAGYIPIAGTNFSTTTQLAGILSDVTHGAVLPLAEVSQNIDPATVKPAHGVLDVQAIAAAQPKVSQAASVLQDAYFTVAKVQPGFGAVPQLSEGIDRLKDLLRQAAQQAVAANTATSVLPAMLGDSGPRTYLVLVQNNAELRATGGIPGAAVEVHVDHGHITLGRHTEAKEFQKFPSPVLPLADQTKGLYGTIVGEYFQDINLVPQFPLTAGLAVEMWKRQYGNQADGVLSIDPVALSYLLQATGSVSLPTGETLDSSNAVRVLLSDAYAKYQGAGKDDFFSTTAGAVFAKIASGGFHPKPMMDALDRSVRERRLLAWSPQAKEQDAIQAAGMSGELPDQTPQHGVFGVYLNDATGAKMDYYLRESYRVGGVVCREDGRPTWAVEVTLTNSAPADAGTSLPGYVTGAGIYGVKPGNVKTQVNVYAPPSSVYLGSWKDGAPLNVHQDMNSGYPVAQTDAELSPGQSVTLRFQFLGAAHADEKPDMISTPTVNTSSTSDLSLSCRDIVR